MSVPHPRAAELPPYRAELPFTYAFGRFAAHEALRHRPADVALVLWHGDMPQPEAERLAAAAAAAGVSARRDDATVSRLRRKASVTCLAQVAKRAEALDPGADHVVLVGPSHPGNVGTAIRSLVAFGFHDLALVAPRVDPWGAYVVRSSVGLRFALRCQSFPTLADYQAGFPRHAAWLLDARGERALDEVELVSPFALVFGPEWREEGAGAALPAPAGTVRIPQGNHVESLNLAISVSIAAYRARQLGR